MHPKPIKPASENIHIRPATPGDLDQILYLFKDTIIHTCSNDYNADQIRVWTASAENRQSWIKRIEEHYFLVAEKNNFLTGFASLRKNDYIDVMYISKDYQRQGIAFNLLNKLEIKALSLDSKKLETDASITARPFFEKQGYCVIKENHHVLSGVDIMNYRMSKNLIYNRIL